MKKISQFLGSREGLLAQGVYFSTVGLFAFSSLLYLISLLHSTIVHRAMYADGSFFFVSALVNGFSDDGKHQRLFVNLINQFPMNLGRFFGITGYAELGYLYDGAVFILPFLLVFFATFFLAKKRLYGEALAILFLFIVFIIPSTIFIINPAIGFFAILSLVVACTIMLDSGHDVRIPLFSFSLLLFRSHETALFIAPVFALHSIFRYLKKRDKFFLLLASTYAGVMTYSFWWGVSHPVATQTSGYINLIFQIMGAFDYYLKRTNLLYSVFGFFVALFVIINRMLKTKRQMRVRKFVIDLILPLLLVPIFTIHLCIMVSRHGQFPQSEFDLRVLITVASVIISLLVFLPRKFFAKYVHNTQIIFVLSIMLLFHSFWQMSHNIRWRRFYVSSTEQILNADKTTRINLDTLSENRYEWLWTWPVFSVVLQEGHARVLSMPWKPSELDNQIRLPKDENDVVSLPFCTWKQGELFTVKEYRDEK
ncbi:MAG: hypothetical protein ACOZAN_03285 [Patescibacteria group bacterium]